MGNTKKKAQKQLCTAFLSTYERNCVIIKPNEIMGQYRLSENAC